jgi:hypothetical protein
MRSLAPLLAALALAGCATTANSHLTEGKAIADAWSAFGAASSTLDSLATQGVLNAKEKAIIKADGPKIEQALEAATAAYDASNDASAAANVTTATTLIAELVTIVGAHK